MLRYFKLSFLFSLLFVGAALNAAAQQYDVPIGSWLDYEAQRAAARIESQAHGAVRPFRLEELPSFIDSDTVLQFRSDCAQRGRGQGFAQRATCALLQQPLVVVRDSDFTMHIDPVFELGGLFATDSNEVYSTNSRGVRVRGSIGSKFSFQTTFIESQTFFPGYQDAFVRRNRVVPGMGRVKRHKTTGWDYQFAAGKLSYSPSKYFNIQFGNGRNHLGEGYRSLLLSDNASNYPFLKLTTKVWKFKYTNLYAQFREYSLPKDPELGFPRKWTAMHHLSYNVTKRLNVGFFEALVWENSDTSGYRGLELEYMNPVILLRPSEFNSGSVDNALMGFNASYKLSNTHTIYGQLIIDELKLERIREGKGWWGNKQGFQLGYKAFDLFGVENLGVRTEFNYVRPFVYSHWKVEQSYGHANQPVAHPLGANFAESFTEIRYRKHRVYGRAQFNYAVYGDDEPGNYVGHSIFESYDDRAGAEGYFVGSGNRTELTYGALHLGYLLNPSYDMALELAFINRATSDEAGVSTNVNMLQLTFKAGMPQRYFDF